MIHKEVQPPLSESIRLTLELHKLIRSGRSSSAAANEIRGEMEHYWWRLPASEQSLLEGLSADLYSIGSDARGDQESLPSIASEIETAARDRNLHRSLEMVRENESRLNPAYVSYWRGVCWADLLKPDVACLFLEDAVRLEPSNLAYQAMLLRIMIVSDRIDAAVPIAERIVADRDSDPLLLYYAAMVLMLNTRTQEAALRTQLYPEIIATVERANSLVGRSMPAQVLDIAVTANLWRSVCYDQLDQAEKALDACEEALRWDPGNRDSLKLRAMLTRGDNPQSSREYARTAFMWPDALASREGYSSSLAASHN